MKQSKIKNILGNTIFKGYSFNMIYTDAHCHLLENIRPYNAEQIFRIATAVTEKDWATLIKNANNTDFFVCIGIHPWYLDDLSNDWLKNMEKILSTNPKIMVGETGIDKNTPNLPKQQEFLLRHIEIAHKFNRPLHLHCVGAWDKALHIFKTLGKKMPPIIVAHSFNGTPEQVETLCRYNNIFFSYSGRQLLHPTTKIIANIESTPNDKILVESDTNNANEEIGILRIAIDGIAKIKNTDTETIAHQTYTNFQKVVL